MITIDLKRLKQWTLGCSRFPLCESFSFNSKKTFTLLLYQCRDLDPVLPSPLKLSFVQINTTVDERDQTNPFRFANIGVEKFLELNSEQNHDEFCLAYVFTDRDFDDGVLGLAWVGAPSGQYQRVMHTLQTHTQAKNTICQQPHVLVHITDTLFIALRALDSCLCVGRGWVCGLWEKSNRAAYHWLWLEVVSSALMWFLFSSATVFSHFHFRSFELLEKHQRLRA